MKYIIQHSSYSLVHPKIVGVTSRAKIAEDWIFNKLKEKNIAFLVSKNDNMWSYGEHRYGFTMIECEEDVLP